MKKLKFKDVEYSKINVSKIPETYVNEIDKISFTPVDCLGNSYEIAKKSQMFIYLKVN